MVLFMPRKSERIPIDPIPDIPLIDCHCHFPLEKSSKGMPNSYNEQYQEFFRQNGKLIITSTGYHSYKFTQQFMKTHDNMRMTFGWGAQTVTFSTEAEHNRDFPKYLDYVLNNTKEYICIGEIGLDFHHAKTIEKREKQIEIFEKIIQETKHLDKPYALHVRNAGPRDQDPANPNDPYNEPDRVNKIILEILEDEQIPPERVMWHCFSGPASWGKNLAEEGYFISVPSSAFGFRRWRRNSAEVPLNQILTETDASWQHPYKMGMFNEPVNVKYAIAAVAYTHGIDQDKVANQVYENALQFFDLKK